jgi:NTP pyrophosphatase (non-canonical NTP hydrolase)
MSELEKAQEAAINHLRMLQQLGEKIIAKKRVTELGKEAGELADEIRDNNSPTLDWWNSYEGMREEFKQNLEKLGYETHDWFFNTDYQSLSPQEKAQFVSRCRNEKIPPLWMAAVLGMDVEKAKKFIEERFKALDD